MNRRSFIADMLVAGTATLFLPGAGRKWKRTSENLYIPNPAWQTAQYEVIHFYLLPVPGIPVLKVKYGIHLCP